MLEKDAANVRKTSLNKESFDGCISHVLVVFCSIRVNKNMRKFYSTEKSVKKE